MSAHVASGIELKVFGNMSIRDKRDLTESEETKALQGKWVSEQETARKRTQG